MCAHLLDKEWEEPRCVEACPTGALIFGEEDNLAGFIKKAEVLHPEYRTKPRVYYICLPKKFIAGSVYNSEDDECIRGATVTLINLQNGEKYTSETNSFGDFWLEGLKKSTYSMVIEKDGYNSSEINYINTENDVNLGDIKLFKKT
jgi:nitrate reductase beta subunit